MIDLIDTLNDPDICNAWTIQRTTGQFAAGGFATNPVQNIPAFGAVRNTSGRELDMVPEADRARELLTFRSTTQMYITNAQNNQLADQLVYHGFNFRVVAVKDYSDQGYYLAVATRLIGD